MAARLRVFSRPLSTPVIGCGSSSGLIAARNAAQKSISFSNTLAETAPRVLSLQRDFLRSVPWIKRAYGVMLPVPEMRALLTEAFRAKSGTSEVHTVNRLIVMGRMELEETLMLWKGASHVNNWFDAAQEAKAVADAKPVGFLDSFFEGRPAPNA